ncbi:hypothetical protein [Cohaesibacter marisflavi]|uniref:hypothetical protein n=1 Tax=Cohaesibacter marisflavi TaxID=655353 RepID=UPI0029C8C7BA|nr:hypothetical protein [Cohaesibacter marisflavi]
MIKAGLSARLFCVERMPANETMPLWSRLSSCIYNAHPAEDLQTTIASSPVFRLGKPFIVLHKQCLLIRWRLRDGLILLEGLVGMERLLFISLL